MKEKENISTKEKLVKNCKTTSIIVLVIELLLLIVPIVFCATGNTQEMLMYINKETPEDYIIKDSIIENDIEIPVDSKEKFKAEDRRYSEFGYNVVSYITSIVILDIIRRMLKDTAKAETPFSEGNLKKLTQIDACITANIIFTPSLFTKDLIYIVLVSSIYLIFKYGYELQTESDETL